MLTALESVLCRRRKKRKKSRQWRGPCQHMRKLITHSYWDKHTSVTAGARPHLPWQLLQDPSKQASTWRRAWVQDNVRLLLSRGCTCLPECWLPVVLAEGEPTRPRNKKETPKPPSLQMCPLTTRLISKSAGYLLKTIMTTFFEANL